MSARQANYEMTGLLQYQMKWPGMGTISNFINALVVVHWLPAVATMAQTGQRD